MVERITGRFMRCHRPKVQRQSTERAGDEDEEEEEEEEGKFAFRQWSRQLRYQLRVQAVARARRVKE